eukprot:TRINITY_DN1136_c0_g1_i1.p1 TRINITY_DN1136_c0_g1~~TRINITY_DN1136_c0_g1_i1.p1  ORF type:complete len:609 (+),score=117.79 TRINITY_DN1136_c0_g1_i1:131-1957(+)
MSSAKHDKEKLAATASKIDKHDYLQIQREEKLKRKRKRREAKRKKTLWLSSEDTPQDVTSSAIKPPTTTATAATTTATTATTQPSLDNTTPPSPAPLSSFSDSRSGSPTVRTPKRKEKKRMVAKLAAKHVRKVFDEFDLDRSGTIDLDELQSGLDSLGLPSDATRVREMMAAVDTNADGFVDFADFMRFVEMREEELRALFKEIDLNGDGVLQPEEIRLALRRLVGSTGSKQLPKLLEDRLIHEFISEMELGSSADDPDGAVGEGSGIDFEEFRQFLMFYPSKTLSLPALLDYWTSAVVDIGDDVLIPADRTFLFYHPLQILAAGGLAGAVSRTCTAPFDRLKVLLQAQSPASLSTGPREYTGIWQGLCKIYREQGWRAFFKGNGTNVVKIVPESAVKFWAYDMFKRVICQDSDKPRILERFLAGSAAGVASQTLIYPLEITKTRLAVARDGEYRGIFDCIAKIVRGPDGARALFRGLLPSLVGIVPYAGVDLAVYTQLRDIYASRYPDEQPRILTLLACGATSSTCGQIVAYPLQLVRTRLQTQGMSGRPVLYGGMVDCFRKTVSSDGFLGLYKGIGPNFLKAIPAISISYVVYEQARWALGMKENM